MRSWSVTADFSNLPDRLQALAGGLFDGERGLRVGDLREHLRYFELGDEFAGVNPVAASFVIVFRYPVPWRRASPRVGAHAGRKDDLPGDILPRGLDDLHAKGDGARHRGPGGGADRTVAAGGSRREAPWSELRRKSEKS
jgi:hypothetical protein